MCFTVGFQKTIKAIRRFPAIILMPIVTFWVVGPATTQFLTLKCYGAKNSVLAVSFLFTWINIGITITSQLILFFIYVFPLFNMNFDYDAEMCLNVLICCTLAGFLLMLFSIALVLLIQFSNRLTCPSKSWYKPDIHKTGYDFDNPHVMINLD